MSKKGSRGVSIIEAVISVAIIMGTVLSAFTVFGQLVAVSARSLKTFQAASLLSEGAEVVRLWRDSNWNNLSTLSLNTDYYYQFVGGAWATSTANHYVDNHFERKFTVASVYRDASDDISTSGSTLDPETKKITVSVSWWQDNATTTKSVSFYLAKLF